LIFDSLGGVGVNPFTPSSDSRASIIPNPVFRLRSGRQDLIVFRAIFRAPQVDILARRSVFLISSR